MVHGIDYGIQYEIYLNKHIDFYNDLLEIWSSVRVRIEMETDKYNGKTKLIVIPNKIFDRQLDSNSLFKEYVSQLNKVYYDFHRKLYTEEEIIDLKFFMVSEYSKLIKHNDSLPNPLAEYEFNRLINLWREIQDKDCNEEFWKNVSDEELKEFETEYEYIYNSLKYQKIIHNSEYFTEIKMLEEKLTNQVILSAEQNELVQKVLSHPKLDGLVSWHGLSLCQEYY
jgi:hypothetical protein